MTKEYSTNELYISHYEAEFFKIAKHGVYSKKQEGDGGGELYGMTIVYKYEILFRLFVFPKVVLNKIRKTVDWFFVCYLRF